MSDEQSPDLKHAPAATGGIRDDAIVRRDADRPTSATPTPTPLPPTLPPPLMDQRARRGGVGSRRLFGAAAAVIVVFGVGALIGFVLAGDGNDDLVSRFGDGAVEFYGSMSGGAGGDAELLVVKTGIGREIVLITDDLAILPAGEYYEVWFVAPDDLPDAPNRISAGTFHPDADGRSDVRFAAAVDPTLFPTIQITAEPEDGDPRASDRVLLVATIDS